MRIDNPAQLSELDLELVQTIGTFLSTEDREAWHRYLLDPFNHDDPTAQHVAALFEEQASLPGSAFTNQASALLYLLGEELQSQQRYREALEVYEHAAAAADSTYRRARALSAQPRIYKELARASLPKPARLPLPDVFYQTLDQGALVAESAFSEWLPDDPRRIPGTIPGRNFGRGDWLPGYG